MSRWQSKVYVNQLLGWSYNRTFPIFFMLQCKKSLTKIWSPAPGFRDSQVLSKVCVNQFQTSTHTASSVSRSQPSFTITGKVHGLSEKNKTQTNYWICTEAHLNVFLHLVHFFFYSLLLKHNCLHIHSSANMLLMLHSLHRRGFPLSCSVVGRKVIKHSLEQISLKH